MTSRTFRIARALIAALEDRVRLLAQKYPPVSEEQIQDLATIDPTGPKASYLEWMAREVKAGHIRWPEDRNRVQRALQNYHEIKSKPSSWKEIQVDPDLFKSMFKYTIHDLEGLYEKRHGREESVTVAPSAGERVIYDYGTYKITRVGGPGLDPALALHVACQYGKGTRWCTKDRDTAESYLKDGPLYIIFKNGRKVAQLHKETDQFMDIHDDPLDMERAPKLVKILNQLGLISDSDYAIQYAMRVRKGPYPEGEAAIARSPKDSYMYATWVLGNQRFPAGEPAIARDAGTAYSYAIGVIKGRFPAGEAAIATNTVRACEYAERIIKGRFPAGEAAIAKSPYESWIYASKALNGPFPLGEPAIATAPIYSCKYAIEVLKGPFPLGEPVIARYGESSILYAEDVLHGRFPAGEAAIKNDAKKSYSYIYRYYRLTGVDLARTKYAPQDR